MPDPIGNESKSAMLSRLLSWQGGSQQGLKMSDSSGAGLAPYGFRHEESASAPVSAKGRGYFGPLSHAGGGISTETDAIYDKAMAFAASRRAAGLGSFAQPTELRMPAPTN